MKNFIFFVLLIGVCTHIVAQQPFKCGTMDYDSVMRANPAYNTARQQVEQHTDQFVKAHPTGLNNRSIVTIPVVVHVIYNTAAQNIPDSLINSQIAALNLDYSRMNSDTGLVPAPWKSRAADFGLQFCLAQRDPNGNATTGIIRKHTSVAGFYAGDSMKMPSMGGDTAWPLGDYLNIWLCPLTSGLLGYGTFPGKDPARDGLAITPEVFGTLGSNLLTGYDKGRVATHEIGHWLNLRHIWGDDSGLCTGQIGAGSDSVSDTPDQGDKNFGCPTYPLTDACQPSSPGVMFMNYMDYTLDACKYMFTNGQKARAQALFTIGGARYSLTQSLGCVPPNGTVPNFTATPTTVCVGSSVAFTNTTTGTVTSYTWTLPGSATPTLSATSPAVVYTTAGVYPVTLTATNGIGSNSITKTAFITVTDTGVVPVAEGFESASLPSGWSIGNPDNDTAWGRTTTTSGFGTSTACMKFDNYNSNAFGTKDFIYTPSYHFTGLTNPKFKFDYAYAPFDSHNIDTLEIWYSKDCGATWTIAWTKNGIGLATNGGGYTGTVSFIPNSTEWKTDSINLSALSGLPYVRFAIVNRSGYGNNVYVDNVNIYGNTALKPIAKFGVSKTSVCPNTAITFTDSSTNNPNAWTWTATGPVTLSSNAHNPTLTFVTPGTYSVKLVASSGVGADSVTKTSLITVRNYPADSVHVTPVSCNGGNDGIAKIYAYSGTAGYTYLWSSGSTKDTISHKTSGNYTITITDASSCTVSAIVNISQPATAITTNFIYKDAACNQAVGNVKVVATGGNGGFTYHWNNNGTNDSLHGVISGIYTVTVKDAKNCSVIVSKTLQNLSGPTMVVTHTDVSCHGGANGTALATPSGGLAPYTYHWSSNGNADTIQGKIAVTYYITVTDANTCTAKDSAIIAEPSSLHLTLSNTPHRCTAAGSATVAASGGNGFYHYSWSNGAHTSGISNLIAGAYQVTVTDTTLCTIVGFDTVREQAIAITAIAGGKKTTCGQTNGSVWVLTNSKSPSYHWNTGAVTDSLHNTANGIYYVTVTDTSGCTAHDSFTISSSGAPSLSFTKTDVACYGDSTGTASMTVTGGTQPYQYRWSSGDTIVAITHLVHGGYSFTVTDAASCVAITSITIAQPIAPLTIKLSSTPHSCVQNGSATTVANGGNGGYSFHWSNGLNANPLTSLTAGIYTVTVKDSKQCSVVGSDTVVETAIHFTDSLVPHAPGCNQTNGSVAVISTAPHPKYVWNTGSHSANLSSIGSGLYTVTVTDSVSGCTDTVQTTIINATPPGVTLTLTPATIHGSSDGKAKAKVIGGTAPYTYLWSNGAHSDTLSNLPAGNYSLTVTDSAQCQTITTFKIDEPAALTVTDTVIVATSTTASDGVITVHVHGGTSPYSYHWSNGQTDSTATGLKSGTYTVTVTDANHATIVLTVIVGHLATGIGEVEEMATYSLLPNPTQDKCILHVTFNKSVSLQAQLFNTLGQMLWSKNMGTIQSTTEEIPTYSLPQGTYYILLKTTDHIFTTRLIKN